MIKVPHRRLSYEPIHAEAGSSFFSRVCGPIPSFAFAWHHHPELELALVTRGRGRRYVGDSIEDFAAGDLVLLGADLPHTWHSDPADGAVDSRVIQFLPEVLGGLLVATPELKPIATLLRRSDRGLRFDGRTRDACEPLFHRIVDAPADGWRRVADLVALLGTMAESREAAPLATAAPRAPGDAQTGRSIDRVFALLHGAPDRIPSQAEAAAALRMAPAAFSRFFRQAVGKTWMACVTEIRVLAACRELIETDRPVIDIAYAAGFENLSNFNRRFRALRGTTPSAFRAARRRAEASSAV